MPKIAILGAGMLGTCLALEMARREIEVDLYDRAPRPVTQAGRRNEGKIHLGFVYGADSSGKTAGKMIDGAMSFYPLLRSWVGSALEAVSISSPFLYAVTHDTLLSPAECERHFASIEKKLLGYDRLDYPGELLPRVEKLSDAEWQKRFNPEKVQAVYKTCERAIDVRLLAEILQRKVQNCPAIAFFPHSTIEHVQEKNGSWEIEYTAPLQRAKKQYDVVINALWDGRIAIDHQLGLVERRPWSYRLKQAIFLHSPLPLDLPSATIIQGPYGDLVNLGQGHYYLSWYPQCMQGFAKNTIAPPFSNWDLSKEAAKELIKNAIRGLSEYIPPVAKMSIEDFSVLGGIIYAGGETDVHDPQSGLHKRYELEIKKLKSYYSINPGKYSLCPAFAYEAATQICAAHFLSAAPL